MNVKSGRGDRDRDQDRDEGIASAGGALALTNAYAQQARSQMWRLALVHVGVERQQRKLESDLAGRLLSKKRTQRIAALPWFSSMVR
jgi:hypothetical protein